MRTAAPLCGPHRPAQMADKLGVHPADLFLAAHAKVLSVLRGERRVEFHVAGLGEAIQKVSVGIPNSSWVSLIRAVAEARDHGRVAERPAGTVVCVDEPHPTVLPTGVEMWVTFAADVLHVSHDATRVAPEFAVRVRGYHLAALRAMLSAPEAEHDDCDLLSPDEVHEQVHKHDAGRTALPDRRFHALFEDGARAHPDTVAVGYRGVRWTYAELNCRANRVAHSLLQMGLRPEDVVAVVTDRNLDWAAAVLGVLKAGGTYLPIDVAYPAERAATQVRLSGARYVLAGNGARTAGFAGETTVLPLVPVAGRDGADHDPRVDVGQRQAAYIYFTSGSTGLPKGAICEHLGMLNHLLAKVEALELGSTDVVVQNAPIGFDISLWQLLAVFLVGGRVEIAPTDDILDAGRFIDSVVAAGATVLQVVPSYLDVLLSVMETQRRQPGRIRRVSVTGEAISAKLVGRWFARFPTIPLVNAYGATEASDDTTHAILDGPPDTTLVPVGQPIRNVTVYVVDAQLRLLPMGSVGEIVFSGICVGRGYVNDPEHTRQTFTADPFRPGERLYRTGDFGRWLPDGNLEFLGRRDEQVKIRGMRVEIGEVEHSVRQVPGVRSAAVVVRDSPTGKRLTACYSADPELTPRAMLDRLSAELPAHLVPHACHRLDELPLTENGKTDRKALLALLAREHENVAPDVRMSATERRLATAWAEVLGRPLDTIAIDDDFFALGGDSLAAVRLVVKVDRAVSLTNLVSHPVLRDLAAFVDGVRPAANATGRGGSPAVGTDRHVAGELS